MTVNQIDRVAKRPRVSPLRYPGGKAALYPFLRQLVRTHRLSESTFVEPYAGGAGAALSLLITGQVGRIVINDLDPAIYAFWQVVTQDAKAVIKFVHDAPLTVQEWQRQREIYMTADAAKPVALGLATFYLNRTNRSGVLNGGPIGGLNQSGRYLIDARFNRLTLAERIRVIALYAKRILVLNQDGKEVIKRYTRTTDSLVYADPPYFEKAGSLYLNSFSPADHASLAKVLNARAHRNWLLTYDNAPQVEQLYADRQSTKFQLHYSAHRVTRATEIMVASDSLKDVLVPLQTDTY